MSPRGRSREKSSSRKAARRPLPEISSAFSEMVSMLDYEPYTAGLLGAVPEREWRLIGALLRKREQDEHRALLADHCHRAWEQEKRQKEKEEEKSSGQYQRFLQWKRAQDREHQAIRHMEKMAEQQLYEDSLIQYIRDKDLRSAQLLAQEYDTKISDLMEKSIQDEARQYLAADRRCQYSAAQESRRRLEAVDTMRRVEDARQRRCKWLRNISQRLAIENALSSWESSLVRQEVTAMECARRARHAHHASLTHERGEQLLRAREARSRRARDVAALCAQLREVARLAPGKRGRCKSLS